MAENSSPSTERKAHSALSLWGVLIVQCQNAFNDNFVKLVLVGLAVTVAAGTTTGKYIEQILAALIPLPFILLAPVSGWFSDRYSKNRVIIIAVVMQIVVLAMIALSLVIRSIPFAIFGFFLLAVQSTLFSPAKQGILKEIVGSKKLGSANGLAQMLTMVGILGGMALGGSLFDAKLGRLNEEFGILADHAWKAALFPALFAVVGAIVPLVLGFLIQRTPEHPANRFHPSIWWHHFLDLKYLFGHKVLKRTGLFIAFYWFVANFVALAFFGFAKELHPVVEEGGVSSATGRMFMILGVGLILGSLAVSLLTRKGNRLSLSVVGGLAMGVGLAVLAWLPAETLAWFSTIFWIGFFSGFFVVPLSAHLQDMIDEDQRGRVLSAQNLLNSLSGMLAIGVSSLLKALDLTVAMQTFLFVLPMLVVSFYLSRMLKQSALQAA